MGNQPTIGQDDLLALAGPGAFDRGVDYFRRGRVRLSRCLPEGFDATARGTAEYRLSFREETGGMEWACSCPAAADGAFCKHLVAGALAWLKRIAGGGPDPAASGLAGLLERQPRETLVQWLHEALLDDPALARRFELAHAGGDARALKKVLASVLHVSGFVDFRASMDLSSELDAPLKALRELRKRDPGSCLELCEFALRRLLRIIERCDDSGGGVGMALEDLAGLHARAARAARPDGAVLAKSLLELKRLEDWELFPLKAYWKTLGRAGRAAYADVVRTEFESLPGRPAKMADSERWSREYHVLKRREELARAEGDFEGLVRVLARALDSAYGYRRIVDTCREFGREGEALAWAERGLASHRDTPGMRELAAGEYCRAGRKADALALLWEEFRQRPDDLLWGRLKKAAGRQWPDYRVRGLAVVADAERTAPDGRRDATRRVRLLWADGDLDAARALARRQWVEAGLLESLADALGKRHPADAADFLCRAVDAELVHADARTYADIVPAMCKAWRLGPGDERAAWIAGIRKRYRARRKLMRLMDEAGLPVSDAVACGRT